VDTFGWVVTVSLLPVLLPAYLGVLYSIALRRDGRDPETVLGQYFGLAYAPFAFGLAGAYLATVGRPTITVRPLFLLALLVGAGGYYLTTVAWRLYTGSPIRRGGRDLWLLVPGLFATVPEELLFREGLAPLIESVGTGGYLVYSSVVFALFHVNGGRHEILAKLLLGVVLGGAYLVSGTIVVPILIHLGYNLAWLLFVTGRFA
jgi:membrane protease YdiL (CAAX protease family)